MAITVEAVYADGRLATVTALERQPGPVPVRNLEVEGDHTYFVGSDGMLVHNARAWDPTIERWSRDAMSTESAGTPDRMPMPAAGFFGPTGRKPLPLAR